MLKTDRSFGAYLVLSFLTFGIYGIWFMHKLAKDTNTICITDGKRTPGVLLMLLLSLVTCGIYQIFWWTGIADRTKRAGERMNYRVSNDPSKVMLWMIGGCFITFFSWVGIHKVIENVNDAAKAYNNLPDLIDGRPI